MGTSPDAVVGCGAEKGRAVLTWEVTLATDKVDFDGFARVVNDITQGVEVEGGGGLPCGYGETVGGEVADVVASREGVVGIEGGGAACGIEVDD